MIKDESFITGKQILEIITSGMYSNPLMVIREYIQNSVDSIDQALTSGFLNNSDDAFIKININGQNRIITIIDNGTGISNDKLIYLLCSLGISSKTNYKDRGFRGIGRLGGLGYCDKLIFETRSSKNEKVGVVTWDGCKIRELCSKNNLIIKVEDVIKRTITINFRKDRNDEPSHFFRVIIENVHRFHKDHLMNLISIKNYLEQVAPVPYDKNSFSFASLIEDHLTNISGFKSYNIFLNEKQLYRPYKNTFQVSTNHKDKIKYIELTNFIDSDGKVIGKGWYAITNFLSALPINTSMRGIRVRQGNIEIGNEYYLAESYAERRFSTWHIGEIHLNFSVKVNARRDDFENSREFEAFLEQARILCKYLSYQCRNSSKNRNNNSFVEYLVNQAYHLSKIQFIIDIDHCNKLKSYAHKLLLKADNLNRNNGTISTRINAIKESLNSLNNNIFDFGTGLDGRVLRHIDKKSLLRNIANEIIKHENDFHNSELLLNSVFSHYFIQKFKQKSL